MRTVAILVGIAAFMSASASATLDPRKCSYGGQAKCGADAAFLAVRKYLSATNHMPSSTSWGSGTHTCVAANAKYTIWRCSWTQGSGANPDGTATVTFRAFSSGWRTSVQLA